MVLLDATRTANASTNANSINFIGENLGAFQTFNGSIE